jgi:hypothetical protein
VFKGDLPAAASRHSSQPPARANTAMAIPNRVDNFILQLYQRFASVHIPKSFPVWNQSRKPVFRSFSVSVFQ